ncbi:hypothetical protein ABT403_37290 [Streptomyces sp. NPDC000075]|uniref:hypothetical protein n=1 Tax=Streptomyces TaxID=1883 RepID=UPI0031D68626
MTTVGAVERGAVLVETHVVLRDLHGVERRPVHRDVTVADTLGWCMGAGEGVACLREHAPQRGTLGQRAAVGPIFSGRRLPAFVIGSVVDPTGPAFGRGPVRVGLLWFLRDLGFAGSNCGRAGLPSLLEPLRPFGAFRAVVRLDRYIRRDEVRRDLGLVINIPVTVRKSARGLRRFHRLVRPVAVPPRWSWQVAEPPVRQFWRRGQ